MISIHALREEGDITSWTSLFRASHFYPRPPRGGRPRSESAISSIASNFYPRPPRGGRLPTAAQTLPSGYFYPRPPRGGRPAMEADKTYDRIFLSTPSARRATWYQSAGTSRWSISIHALREEGDVLIFLDLQARQISIHALREEGDR